jgi:hypothetical protein
MADTQNGDGNNWKTTDERLAEAVARLESLEAALGKLIMTMTDFINVTGAYIVVLETKDARYRN